MDTLVERLRAFPDNVLEGASLCEEAAARIERLEAEIATLKARYEPNLPESAVSKGELQTARWDKVQAIKAYRARVGCSLREAAHAIDAALSAQRGGE